MEEVRVRNTYTKGDIEANNKLSRCQHCGGDIFFLTIFKEARSWWHEEIDTDFDHLAEPEEVE